MKSLVSKLVLAVGLLSGLIWLSPAWATRQDQLQESEAIGYRRAESQDAAARLQRRINSGDVKLDYSEKNGCLESVLKVLNVPHRRKGWFFPKRVFNCIALCLPVRA